MGGGHSCSKERSGLATMKFCGERQIGMKRLEKDVGVHILKALHAL